MQYRNGAALVALTGGSSPVAIYKLWQPPYKAKIDWQNVFVFCDERWVPLDDARENGMIAF
jgi:6-phosphogluconolactonase/glucosamine-6-phosphate isomerase/deaminase